MALRMVFLCTIMLRMIFIYMGRKKLDNPKVQMSVSVRKTTKDHIRENNINAGQILDDMFKDK